MAILAVRSRGRVLYAALLGQAGGRIGMLPRPIPNPPTLWAHVPRGEEKRREHQPLPSSTAYLCQPVHFPRTARLPIQLLTQE